MAFEYIINQKNGKLLNFNSFLYKKERENENKIIWKCVEYNSKKCRGRLHSSGLSVVHTTEHNHVADIAKVEAKEAMARLKNIAKTTQLSTHSVLGTLTLQVYSL